MVETCQSLCTNHNDCVKINYYVSGICSACGTPSRCYLISSAANSGCNWSSSRTADTYTKAGCELEKPSDNGCWVHAPNGCPKLPTLDTAYVYDNHDNSAYIETRCLQRAAEYDGWCPTTGTIAVFNKELEKPSDNGCWVHAPNGCPKLPTLDTAYVYDNH